MSHHPLLIRRRLLLALAVCWIAASADLIASPPSWIWSPEHPRNNVPETACYFRRTFELEHWAAARIEVGADDSYQVFVNGIRIGRGAGWKKRATFDIANKLRRGTNVIAIRVQNKDGNTAGLLAAISVEHEDAGIQNIVTDEKWKTSIRPLPTWFLRQSSERKWIAATNLGPLGETAPWLEPAADASAAARSDESQAATLSQDSTEPQSALRPSEKRSAASRKTVRNNTITASPLQETQLTKSLVTKRPTTVKVEEQTISKHDVSTTKFRVANEFSIQHVAGHAVTGSLIAMTFDEHGRILASRERGPLILVYDDDGDGVFDKVREYCTVVNNCQGIIALNGDVYVVADGPQGVALYRLRDTDRDGQLEDVTPLVGFQEKIAEHGPHGITLGPDGMLYLMVGNHTKLTGKFTDESPVRHYYEGDLVRPRWQDPGGHATGITAPAGAVIRTDIHGQNVQLFASGLRNAYDLAFNDEGELFTHDADMESDEGTSWYRPTRVNHVIAGSEFGWRSGWAKWPEYFIDNLPAITETGRGSPAGIVCYNHTQFPVAFHGALFTCDWSEGRILAIRMKSAGASYRASTLTFLEGKPLGVTDIEVGPDGWLYFTTGGRDTKGSIYRVVWDGKVPPHLANRGKGIDAVLRQPQLQSAWARQAVAQVQHDLGSDWANKLTAAYRSDVLSPNQRARALQVMQWFGPQPNAELLLEASHIGFAPLRAKAAELMPLHIDDQLTQRLIEMLDDASPMVRRRACEALARNEARVPIESLKKLLISEDRYEAWAARRLLEMQSPDQWEQSILATDHQRLFIQGATALMIASPTKQRAQRIVTRTMEFMEGFINDLNFVDMLRVMQLAFLRGEIMVKDMPEVPAVLAEEFPSAHHVINRELIRLLTYLQVDTIIPRYLSHLESGLPLVEQTHLASHLARIKTNWTPEQRLRLYRYLEPTEDMGNSVPGYLQIAAREFGLSLDDSELDSMIARGGEYPSAAMAAVLKLPRPLSERHRTALFELDRKIKDEDGEAMRRLKVAILAVLAQGNSSDAMAYLREVYDRDPARRVEVALGLSEAPGGPNWNYLVRSLSVLDGPAAREVMKKLRKVARTPRDAEPFRQVILTGMKLKDQGADEAVALLEHWNDYAPSNGQVEWTIALKAWKNWFQKNYPDEAPPELMLSSHGGKWDYEGLLKHLSGPDGRSASVERGSLVYSKAKCASCHKAGATGESMGPDLTKISKRFLKQEILDSIMYPSKTISDQYVAKTVITDSGKTYNGIVGNGLSGEIVVLQSDGNKVRLPQAEIDEMVPSKISAMPEGLLDTLTLQEITDLFAFLAEPNGQRLVTKPSDTSTK